MKKEEGKQLLIIDHVLVEKLKAEQTNNAYAVAEIVVPSKAGPPLHQHEAQETFYILTGTFVFKTLEENTLKTIEAHPGDLIHVPSNIPHTFSNTGTSEGRILGWLNPTGMELFFDKIGTPYKGELIQARKPGLWQMLKIGVYAKKFGVRFVKEPKNN